jgi:hypothetical protein
MRKTSLIVMSLILASIVSGCGGGADGGGQIALEIENAYQPEGIELPDLSQSDSLKALATNNNGIDPLRVAMFRVTISGEDMEDMVTEADAQAEQIQVLGITPGERNILIEAYNGLDEVIRRRLIEGVTIKAGVVTPIQTSLNTIPIVLNFRNNAVVLSRYFRIYGFGEPEATLAIESLSDTNGELNLSINALGDEITVSPATDTGLFEHVPGTHAIGKQDITLTDTTNGESSSKGITLVDANDRPGFRFVTAGSKGGVVTMGTGFGGAPDNHYPLVLDALTDR